MAGRVEVASFGCRLNILEGEAIRRAAERAGCGNVLVVNSCAVTAEAVRQVRQAIRRARRDDPAVRIVVTGCAAETEPETFRAMAADLIVGNRDKAAPATWDAARLALGEGLSAEPAAAPAHTAAMGTSRGFVAVQTGCDHSCTFCIIPQGRGPSRSTPSAAVVAEVRRLVAAGRREVVLTGVDLTSYGGDLGPDLSLGRLVRAILRSVPELERLRLSSIDAAEADADLLAALAEEERLMPHLHLSLQAGDDLVLKRMKRRHTRAGALAFIDHVRRLRPDMVLGADLIAGFPTETEEQARATRAFAIAARLAFLNVFPFSARPGTPAALMPQVPGEVVAERARRLRAVGAHLLRSHLSREVGATRRVLAEAGEGGYTEHFTPVRLVTPVPQGMVAAVRIIGHDGKRLIAAAVQGEAPRAAA